MPKFYFTYGSEGHPFNGGWTEIDAPDDDTACAVFRAFHPDGYDGMGMCCSILDEDGFAHTKLPERGNLGRRCHETITLTRTLYTEDDNGEQ